MSPLVVAVVGASGETGGSIVNALLETPDNFVRFPSLTRPSKIQDGTKTNYTGS